MKSTQTLKTPRFRPASIIAFILLGLLTPSTRAEVPSDPPGKYSTSWLGNTYMDADGHKNVTEELTDLCLSPNGRIFTAGYAETWGGGAEYKADDGGFVARYKQAIRFAAECGVPVVNTDEGPKPSWTTEAEDFTLMRYTLMEAAKVAEPRGSLIGIEPHQQYSKHPDGLDRIFSLVKSPAIGFNFDTGNSYLCGHDPLQWLARVADRLVHLHAKDISDEQSSAERGKVAGTPVGCACGDGVIDWAAVIEICRKTKRDIVLSVECGTVEQAGRSIEHLRSLALCCQ